MSERICISHKNTKIGATMSVSLPPRVSCPEGVPCFTDCYAQRLSYIRPTMRESWARNWRILQADIGDYFEQVSAHIIVHEPQFFRWHVAGDIPSAKYFMGMVRIARKFKETAFAVYTKTNWPKLFCVMRREAIPENLSILRSTWGDFDPMPNARFEKAQFVPRGQEVPEGGFICPGSCVDCRECWAPHGTVYFRQH